MNIYEIAKEANVSVSTVSRVINGNEHVREESRRRVTEVIEKSGFVPNFFARSLNRKQTKMVGILCPVISDINHAKQVSVLESRLRKSGFDIILCSLEQNYDDKQSYLELLIQKQVDAIFIIGVGNDDNLSDALLGDISTKVPIIIINGKVDVPNVYSVVSNERQMASVLVQDLCLMGCSRIAYIYDSETYSGNEKRGGYLEGMKNCNLDTLDLVCKVEEQISMNDVEGSADVIRKFLESMEELPDAIITADDVLAVPAQKVITAMGKKMPIIGWNNSMYSQIASPAISSVDINMDRMSEVAVMILMKVLEQKTTPKYIEVQSNLIERESFVSACL